MAEVLITLGIIGVVAAMTLPSLVQNYKKHEVETKLAKVYSVMNQAIQLTSNEYGEPADWFKDCGVSSSSMCNKDEALEWFKQYIGKNLKYANIETFDNGVFIYLSDGTILFMRDYIYDFAFYINKKAINNPKPGINRFEFKFLPKLVEGLTPGAYTFSIKPTFEPNVYEWDGTRDSLFIEANRGCNSVSSVRTYCAKLIQINGWKIPKDYPLKF